MTNLTFAQYAAHVIGGPPEDAADWEAVARALYAELTDTSDRVTLDFGHPCCTTR